MSEEMTRRDRQDLAGIVRKRERVAIEDADRRGATMKADVEQQLSARFSYDQDNVWAEVYAEGNAVVAEGQARIAKRCAELGIPKNFAPTISGLQWRSRRENAIAERRTELRRLAHARIEEI